MRPAQSDAALDKRMQILIPLARIPGKPGPAAGVVPAFQTDFVAVVDAGRAGIGHLEQRRQAIGRIVAPGQGPETGRIVAAQQVELHLVDRRLVQAQDPCDLTGKSLVVQGLDAMVAAAGHLFAQQVVAHEIAQAGLGEQVVHHRVELVALQPAARLRPDLTHDVGLGIDRPDPSPELLPEGIVVDFGRYVQPPAVNTKLDPVAGDIP